MIRSLALALVALMSLHAIAVSAALGQLADQDLRLIEGLRQRRVFSLAERICRDQRAAEPQSAVRADWTVELMRTLAAKAAQASRQQRDDAWREVHAEAEQFAQTERDNPRKWLVEYQDALSRQARAELLRYEIGDLQQGPERDQAMTTLREAAMAWDALARTG